MKSTNTSKIKQIFEKIRRAQKQTLKQQIKKDHKTKKRIKIEKKEAHN